ncbi:cytokine-dependent hematopoietic cell linker [Astyanax mexicanus]|uniref:Cytokine-dependent hematopoietic cell linker n=1 Tax=Astyanax mexicanus TaxID=7994 RepID=A0A8T2KYL3_ASTMX|nr:cytokine-dependent hematopoietic cell linker [Astyanax mexicanus]
MNRNLSPLKMDHLSRGDRFKPRSDHHSDSDEGDYHQPEEPVIRYPFPTGNQFNQEYADRLPMRPRAPQGGTVEPRNLPPRPPKRTPGNAAPAINRDLKPGRQPKITPGQTEALSPISLSTSKHPPRPVKSLPRDPVGKFSPPAALLQPYDEPGHSPPHRAPPTAPQRLPHNNTDTCTDRSSPAGIENVSLVYSGLNTDLPHRLSLDLESHDLERSLEQTKNARDSGRRQHHEWPQAKGDANHASYTGHSKPVEAPDKQDWYVGAFSRVEAEHALHLVNQEGAYLVRDCSRNTTNEPYVLAVFYENRVFNIQIRFCQETSKYSLGTRVKTNDTFDSVAEIIKFHSIFPIVLIDGRNPSPTTQPKRHCILLYPITSQDMNQLLS